MTIEKYPEIGSNVSYLRADDKGNIHKGTGIIRAIFLSPDKRLQAQVRDGDAAWNVDFFCINPDDHVHAAYAKMIADVQELTDEGNKLVRETVSSYNDKVKQVYDAVIGEPVDYPDDDLIVNEDEQEQRTH